MRSKQRYVPCCYLNAHEILRVITAFLLETSDPR
jgi:hypothetical protein